MGCNRMYRNPWGENTNYIWLPENEKYNKSEPVMVYFRRSFNLDEVPECLFVRVSADSRYRLSVNGIDISCGPCKGDMSVWYYERMDIAPYLHVGENVIGGLVLRYPLEHGKGNLSVFRTSTPCFYFYEEIPGEIENEKPDENLGFVTDNFSCQRIGISADENWKVKICKGITILPESDYSRYMWNKEDVDGHLLEHGWNEPGFLDKDWMPAKVYLSGNIPLGSSPRNIVKRPIPLMYEKEKVLKKISCIRESQIEISKWNALLKGEALILEAGSKHIIEIDAGELTTGYPEFYLKGGDGSHIELLCSESYWLENEEGRHIKRNREDCINGKLIGYTDDYVVAGIGNETKPEIYSTFWFRTFRFIRLVIEVGVEDLCINKICYRETGYPLEEKTKVETSDQELNAIWDISLRTLKRCMHETYEDCPYYEQMQYAMDTRAQILFTYYVSGDDRLARKCIDDFHRSLRPDGLTNCCYPSTGPNVIPGFSLYYIFMIHDHMMFFGDKTFVEKYINTAERILQFFESRRNESGLVSKIGDYNGHHSYWSFIDWTLQWKWGVPNAITKGSLTMESMLYLMALQKVAELAEYIGREGLNQYYNKKAHDLQLAIKKHCYDEELGLFFDGPGYKEDFSQHVQVFAILTKIVEGKQAEELMKRVIHNKSLTQCSVAMSYYMFRAFEMSGCYSESEFMWEPWKIMLENNMTTCVESPGEGRSDCHAWGASALYEIPAVILGVKPVSPGYEKLEINPCMAFLDHASGVVTTPKGDLKISWNKDVNGLLESSVENISYAGEIVYKK